MGTVRVEDEHYPEGELFEIPGLGAVPNMGEKEVDEAQIATYEAMTGATFPEDGNLTISNKEPEPEEEPEESAPVEPSPEGPAAESSTGGDA
jgi:hypothetical protein